MKTQKAKALGAQEAVTPISAEQPLSGAERALVEEAYSRLMIFRDGCREMHELARQARRIAMLRDDAQEKTVMMAEGRMLQLPTLRSTINNCIADQMDNMPSAVMMPETQQMQAVSEELADVVRFVLNQNAYEDMHRARAADFFITGTSVVQTTWDETMDHGKGNVRLVRWPVEAFLWDPVAEDIQDARALIKVSWHPMSWYAAHFPKAAPYVGAETYGAQEVGVPDAWANQQPGDEERALLMEYWYRRYDHRAKRYTVSVAYIAGHALLEHAEDVYAHGEYPFIVDVYERIEGLPVGTGMVHEFKDMMRYINRYYYYFDINLRMASHTRLLVQKSAGINNRDLTDFSKQIIEGTNIGPDAVRPFSVAQFNGAGNQVALQLQADIKQDSGQNQFSRGEVVGGVTAASAIAALQEAGGKITRMRTSVLNQGFRRMVEQMMWLIAEFYTDARTQLITGKDGREKPVNMNAEHLFGKRGTRGTLPPPPYSVQVQVQRRNPMRVQAQNELFLQAYSMATQAGQKFPLSALFEMMSVDGKDAVLPVILESEAQEGQMQQMAQALQKAQAQIQTQEKAIANLQQALGKDVRGGEAPAGPPEGMPGAPAGRLG